MASLIPPGYLSAIIPGRHPIFSGCLTAAIPPGCLSRHSTRSASHFLGYLTAAILSGRRSTFSGYFTPDSWYWMGKENNSTSNWAYKSRCLFKLKHLTVEHFCSELVPSIQNSPASLHGNLAIHTFSSICFFDWELIVLNWNFEPLIPGFEKFILDPF